MTISKEELIEEITEQLQALSIVADAKATFHLSETLAVLDLQFRLKCKLYELTKEETESNEIKKLLREIQPVLQASLFGNYKDQNKANELYNRIDQIIGSEKEGAESND